MIQRLKKNRKCIYYDNCKKCINFTFKVCVPKGNNDMFSTVALNSSTLALIGPDPLLNGFIST